MVHVGVISREEMEMIYRLYIIIKQLVRVMLNLCNILEIWILGGKKVL